MEYLKELELEMMVTIIIAALIMLYSLWLTRRLFEIEKLVLEQNKRITILSESISLNRDKIILNDIERIQEIMARESIGGFKDHTRGSK